VLLETCLRKDLVTLMRRMPPTEKSEMTCFDFDRVTDLNRQDGETISMDYQDLFGLDVIEKCREEAEKSDEVFRSFNLYSSEIESYGRASAWYKSDKVEDLSLHTGYDAISHLSDDLQNTNVHKEYTDLSNKTFLDSSLESLRTAIEVNTIALPLDTKATVDKVNPIHVNTSHPETGVGGASGLVTTFVKTGYQLRPQEEVTDSSWSVIKKTEKVSPISVEEERVREALGLPSKTSTPVSEISYNPTFSEDRLRNTEASTVPGEIFPDYPLYPAPSPHTSIAPLISSHTDSCLPSPYPHSDSTTLTWSSPGDYFEPGHQGTVSTKLVPYRIKKIEKENKPDQSQRLTRDEKAAQSLNIPYSVHFIINCSMEEFNDILNNKLLSSEQIGLCRDIRRRGKNKIAAQNCRKRKIDQICNLEEELDSVRSRKRNILNEREVLMFEHMEWVIKLQKFEKFLLESLGMSPDREWEFLIDQDAQVKIVEKC